MLNVEGHGEIARSDPEQSILELCESAGIEIEAACGGFACCNTCRVQVLKGPENLSPLLDEEQPFLDAPDQRLGCQALVLGPVSIRLAPGA